MKFCEKKRQKIAEKNAEKATKKMQNNLTKTDLKNLGLLSERGNFLFKNRIIFPITNLRNETVGFGGALTVHLLENDIIPILIDGNMENIKKAYNKLKKILKSFKQEPVLQTNIIT